MKNTVTVPDDRAAELWIIFSARPILGIIQ